MSRRGVQQCLLAAAIVAGILLAATQPCLARYTWEGDGPYEDTPSWARAYVESMRQGKVIAGYEFERYRCANSYCWWETYWRFYPSDDATRAWWGMCLMEVLGTLEDYSYKIGNTDWYWNGRRWFRPYANDMLAMGLIPPQTFQDGYIRRDEAFSWSVRALGLRPVAEAMSESEINQYLNRFSDGWRTDPQYRADMALCIKLGLARGYDDGRLHPDDYLLRSSGAVLASRLLSVRLEPSPEIFRPRDGQTVTVRASNHGMGTVTSWTLKVAPASSPNDTIRSWSGSSLPTVLAVWDGRYPGGSVCPSGRYLLWFSGKYRTPVNETVDTECVRTIVLDGRWFAAAPFRTALVAGAPVYVKAWGEGTRVSGPSVTASWGASATLSWDGSYGEGVLTLPAPTPEGSYRLDFSAVLGASGLPNASFSASSAVTVVQERVSVSAPGSFAPGRGEVLPVSASARGYTSAVSWTLRILNGSGSVVRQYSGSGLPSALCSWDGRDASGRPCPGGTYTLALESVRGVDTGKGQYNLTCTASTQVVLDGRVMEASLSPTRVVEGEQVTVSARARDWSGSAGSFADARVLPSWGGEVVLSGMMSDRSAALTVPAGAAGNRTVEVRGTLVQSGLSDVTVSQTLPLTVDAELRSLSAAPATGRAVAGAVLYVTATTRGDVLQGPTAEGWGQSVPMQQTGGGSGWEKTWKAVLLVPAGAAEGPAQVVVRAQLGQQGAQPKWFQVGFNVAVVREYVDLNVPGSFAPVRGESLAVRCSSAGVTQPVSWSLRVEKPSGQVVRQFSGTGQPDPLCTWDGRDVSGNVVSPGSYVLRLDYVRRVDTGAGNPPYTLYLSDTATVIVDGRQLLQAWVEANPTVAGAPLWVDATYSGQLVSGRAEGNWGKSAAMAEVSPGRACGQMEVPQSLAPGGRTVTVRVTLRQSGLPDLEL
ncbi:MAG: hypothetical protein AB1609_18520, partial [Bacillota bacterium]